MKRTHLFLFILLSLSVIAAGCTGYESSSEQSVYPESDMLSYDLEETSTFDDASSFKVTDNGAASQSSVTRKVITTSSVSIEVKNTPEALDDISDIADEFDGYVSSSSVYTRYGDDEGMYGYITIRVPSSELDKVLDTMGDLGKVTSESTTASDVTEEYIDVSARLSNLEKQETRLGEILEMSTTVEEVLSVEKELGRVRGEIESLTGRLNYLNDRIDLATINVDVSEPRNITHSWGLRDALSDSVRGFIGSVNGIIVFIGVAIPIVIFVSIVGVMLILLKRRVWR
ncbi:DUF4349 domain-containing protein [Methanococcoides alaskense]|uniref:DUF4349 domain-containing protein n=1 Tax=Methanococcoides alaskense TaxID=325778 RepID=A0AA90TYZ4_9EURY|nr:DUF4349 domain-containing protein [Methanococcoides alaskense]MDA0524070.1 DUF4349 domain-containing protein [Methanococcoides alaskense]MDR6222520.1 hypothetical protein [Methanococcoides alaskense]